MVLHVNFDHLAEEAKRHDVKPWAYVSIVGSTCTVTIGDPKSRLVIQAETTGTKENVFKALTEQGFLVATGRWLPDPLAGEIQIEESIWVASVAYKSSEEKPGLSVHAYRGGPSTGDVLKDFYDEMIAEAMLEHVSLDDFVAAVVPNVLILSPHELSALVGHCPPSKS